MIKHIITLIWNKRRKNFLLFLEIFLAFAVLFVVFTFAIQYFRNYQQPLGFETEDIWLAYLDRETEMDSIARLEMKLSLERSLEELPQIESVSWVGDVTPFGGSTWQSSNDDNGFELSTQMSRADEDFIETMGMKIVEGRDFTADDVNGKYEVVLVSNLLRTKYFKQDPILDSIYNLGSEGKVVGVVDHYKYHGEFEEEMEVTFRLFPKGSEDLPNLAIRLKAGTPADFEEVVNKTIASYTKRNDFIIRNLESERIESSREHWIPLISALSICGFLIINVALGLFGVLWFTISKRRAEIGLRRTLGATKTNITNQFVGEVFMVAFFAILIGSFFAVQLPLMNVLDVADSNYYLSMAFTCLLILSVVLLCSFLPSRQASQIHPALALHEE